jgi:hypothetical protein
MPNTTIPTEINLKEDATVRLSLKGLWAIVVSIVAATIMVSSSIFNLNYKIERLAEESQQRHEIVMVEIQKIDLKQNLFVLKHQVIEALVWSRRDHDDFFNVTNALDMKAEVEYRRALKAIIDGE